MDDDENDEIAAAMGFASFGGTKKRKFDHAASPKAGPDASGANSTKLGVRSKKVANEDEINLDDAASDAVSDLTNPAPQPHHNAPGKAKKSQPADSGLAAFLARGQNLPEKPAATESTSNLAVSGDPTAAEMVSFGGPPISKAELNALRHGVRMENGDTAYFLPSFVEDPWARLGKGVSG
ncbi:hypothetical protein J4E86_006925 [Alternaria arbusti]|uniref:uncharacterized protein n=1 Tax=Alternaria arbusti TaxID=232088 RepID=UPI00221F32DC|nr:uncharacterized protein J4E86_006925 [Alternaria arbusti]KAI4953382.1 hypothetical protein J4E86_006925 [Alternaria arbusti]